jgi:sulfite dehydrogenase (cytochrome) subunit B
MKIATWLGLVVWVVFGTGELLGATTSIALPEEIAQYRPGKGVDLANSYCMGCHSADYVLTQPPAMPRSFWAAEVKKMKTVFGAPIPDDQVEGIVNYLVHTYGDPKK